MRFREKKRITMLLELEYFYGSEAEQYSFYRIPKVLLTDHRYKSVSMEAKVLCGPMLDRMGLSVRNGWLDSEGGVYIYFTQEDAMGIMDCGRNKAVKLFADLDSIGLIERKRQGQGRLPPPHSLRPTVKEAMQRNTTQVANIRAYTLSALYNVPVTIGQYYASRVSHDMAQDWEAGT